MERNIFFGRRNNNMDTSILLQAGLTEGETKVYLALLEIGLSTTGPIVERSGISRSIIYQILEKLAKKGLVSRIIKNRTKYYQAADPSSISYYLEEEEKKFSENRKKVEALLPMLHGLQKTAKASEATLYYGFRGMIAAHDHSYDKLSRGDDYYYMGIPHDQPEHVHAHWKRDHMKRIKAGIRCRLLFSQKTPRRVLLNRNSYWGCDARYMPFGIETPAWFFGYKDTVVISFPYSNAISVEIVNKEIAGSFQAYFEEFWKRSKRFR